MSLSTHSYLFTHHDRKIQFFLYFKSKDLAKKIEDHGGSITKMNSLADIALLPSFYSPDLLEKAMGDPYISGRVLIEDWVHASCNQGKLVDRHAYEAEHCAYPPASAIESPAVEFEKAEELVAVELSKVELPCKLEELYRRVEKKLSAPSMEYIRQVFGSKAPRQRIKERASFYRSLSQNPRGTKFSSIISNNPYSDSRPQRGTFYTSREKAMIIGFISKYPPHLRGHIHVWEEYIQTDGLEGGDRSARSVQRHYMKNRAEYDSAATLKRKKTRIRS